MTNPSGRQLWWRGIYRPSGAGKRWHLGWECAVDSAGDYQTTDLDLTDAMIARLDALV